MKQHGQIYILGEHHNHGASLIHQRGVTLVRRIGRIE